jgi:hypothetical protein
VNGATYRQKEGGSTVSPSIRGMGNKAAQKKTHPSTRALSLCGPDDPWEGNALVT